MSYGMLMCLNKLLVKLFPTKTIEEPSLSLWFCWWWWWFSVLYWYGKTCAVWIEFDSVLLPNSFEL